LQKSKIYIVGLFSIILLGIVYSYYNSNRLPVKYIAYVGRFTNYFDSIPVSEQVKSDFHVLHVQILLKKLNEMNAENHSYRLELKTFDCEQNPQKSKSIYKQIEADSSIIAVIDNSWGTDLEGAKEIIRNNNIPVIAINADRNAHNYGETCVFTENNDLLPNDLVLFTKKILKLDTITFISEADYKLHKVFIDAFKRDGIVVNKLFEIKNLVKLEQEDSVKFFTEIENYYKLHPSDNNLIIINTHYQLGNSILKYFSEHLDNKKLLGHAYITSMKDKLMFGKHNNNELILMTDPQDAVSKDLHMFEEQLLEDYPEFQTRKNNNFYIKRCFNALSIFKYGLPKDTIASHINRNAIAKKFESLKNQKISIDNEVFEINNQLEVQKEYYFSSYRKGEIIAFHQQLNLQKEVIPDMLFGMDIQDIFEIDLNTNSFTADFYYWVKYDSIIQNAEKLILFQNMKQSESSVEMIQSKQKGGTVYKLFKVSGKFFVDYNESHYPFDSQELPISVQILSSAEKIKISFDKESFIQDKEKLENFTISSWNKKKYYVTVDNLISSNIRGDIENTLGELNKFKTITFRLMIERRTWSGLLQIVLPLSFIGLLSLALLYVKNMSFENLGEASVGTFLSIIAFSISLSDISPSSDLITKADKVFLLTFVTVFLSFLTIIVLNSIYDEKDIIGKTNIYVSRFRMMMTILYPVLFLWFILS
jgi:hypothetical protein